ncbi:extracellular solute-binding protein family 5 [Methylocella silvestris BL2]|uniref:Extracellular solute-binding protein family 5 n=1 Tax=Methylocella silvestris (strain DSM 15510 / CIP 108128 / LMG 27833 / NCIMB 13906 / BL2) TaxID=395965 RepID=B8EMW6_METSB|nr:extracellular solute-binding protein [Methylocella silvestris]ACK52795.1 extracellular solute-binding protein family 5 [Methylocella silvestris BL2]
MRDPLAISRRSFVQYSACGLIAPRFLTPPAFAAEAFAAGEREVHGLSVFGDLALPADFPHFAYVNPEAPKGGEISLQVSSTSGNQNFTTFNTLNAYILKGDGAAGMGLIFDSLMTGNADEPDSLYGLVARAVRVSADRSVYRFLLRKEARFHDGSPLTAADVAFSLNILKAKGHPSIRQALRDLDAAEDEADDIVMVRLKSQRSREAPLIVAGQPIFSAAYYKTRDFDQTTLEPPLGSGGYKVGRFDQGHFISFERVADYWGKDLPVNIGQSNFDRVRFEYFGDRKVAFEAFKAGVFSFREEFTSAVWATGYDFAAVKDGRVQRATLPDESPMGTQGWFLNMRRDKFRDPRIREAIGLAFDFEWTNRNIMYGVYSRTVSFFQNSPMAAQGKPSPEELALLEPCRGELSPDVFGEVYTPPVSDGSGQDRALLRRANDLFVSAGCKRQGSALILPDGKPFEIEFLDFDGALEPHTAPFIKNLKLLGIEARYRVVDAAQYKRRTDDFDYDIVTSRFGLGLTPGEGMRATFGSEAADMAGSRNVSGIKNKAVDALIEKALVAETREELTFICRSIDRILRAMHPWVPMWNKPNHLVAYWDLFSRPERSGRYEIGVLNSWWYDEEKAKRINFAGR